MASTSEIRLELDEILPSAIPERDDTGQNSETQLTTACEQEQPTSSPTTSQESEPRKPEPPKSSAFYKKTYTSGTIRFIKDNTRIDNAKVFKHQFIKINADAGDNKSILQQVAEGVVNKLWQLRRKNLLLSVTSGADELDEEGLKAFKEGIKKMLPGTCMVTCGTNDGVTPLVGEAVHEYRDHKYRETISPTIGIVSLDRIRNTDTIKPGELTRGVFGIDSDGELFTVDKSGERWTLNPASLTEVNVQSDGNTTTSPLSGDGHSSSPRFAVGDLVQIRNEPEILKDYQKGTIGKIGSIEKVDVDSDKDRQINLNIKVYGEDCSRLYKPEALTLFTGERVIGILKTHFESYEPSDENDELIQAVMGGDAKHVYSIIRQAYKDFRELTSASFGVDHSGNFFVLDAKGERRTFTPDDITKDSMSNAIASKAVDTSCEFAPGDLVMILPTAYIYEEIEEIKPDRDQRICKHELTTTIDDVQDKANTERYLDPHHHLFVLVEGSTLKTFGGEIEFRALLAKQISLEIIRSRMKGGIYQDRPVPLVNLVLNNDQYTLGTLISATDKGIPSVVITITDSDTHKRQDSAISDSKNEIFTKILRTNPKLESKGCKRYQEIFQKKQHLLAVINLSDMSQMLVEMILDVFWKASSVSTSLLEWALRDRYKPDVIKRLVCADTKRVVSADDRIMNSDAIAFTMNYFLNDVDVVGALVKLDVDMNSHWIEARQYETFCNDNDGLLKRLKSKAKHTVLWVVMQRVKERPVRGTYNVSEDLRPATYAPGKQPTDDVLPYWEYMFIWALLLCKHEIAKILWTKTEHPLFMALIARNLFKAVKKQTDDNSLIVEMENNMREWSTVAIDCLNECYQTHDEATYVYLTMTMPFWNNKSCLDLAVKSKNKEFLAQKACRNLVRDVWNGHMEERMKKLQWRSDTGKTKVFFNKMQAPKTKFTFNVISYLAFLILFAYVLLFDLPKTVSTMEFVLMAWVLTVLVEEIRQMHQIYKMPGHEKAIQCEQRIRKLKNYFLEVWNCIDLIMVVMFLIGFGLRFIQFRDTSFDWPRVVLAVDFVVFFFRLLQQFSIQKILGPKLIIIRRMVQDLLYFLVIMAVFLLAYAIASHSILYPNAPVTWETARQIIRKPYLHLYGELFLDETEDLKDCTNDASLWKNGTSERCPSETGRIVGPIMMAVYLLFSNILMLNLLIAMFSYTFNKIHERSEKIWCFQRYIMVKDYVQRPVQCPPVNVFWHIYQLFRCCLHECSKHELLDDPFHYPYDYEILFIHDRRQFSLNEFMQAALRRYLARRDHLTKNAVNEEGFRNQALKGIEALNKKVDGLETKADREDEFRRHVLDQLKEMKESINNLHRKMADSRHKADEKTEP